MAMANLPRLDPESIPFELDFSSSDNFYAKLLDQVADALRKKRGRYQNRPDDGRQRSIVMMHARGDTLDEIGRKFNVTRERIRQIERKVWVQIALFKGRLDRLKEIIVSILRKNGGFDRIENVVKGLKEVLPWSDREIRYLLRHYFEMLSDEFVFVNGDSGYVSLTDHLCWKCDRFEKMVKEVVRDLEDRNESLTLDQFTAQVRRKVGAARSCADCSTKMSEFSPELLRWLFGVDSELRRSQERMTVRRDSRFLGLNRSVLLVLKIAKRPLTKTQILAELKKMFPKREFSVKQIQSTTSNSQQCSHKIFLWDRGGIRIETLYVHRDYINTDLPILETIEKRLIAKAEEGKIPQVRLNRLFNRYSEECIAQGIPNVYALFSSLKVRGCPKLIFQRSPYIGFNGNHQKLSNAKILEAYVKKCNRPVTHRQIREFGRTLGLQDEHISNTIVLTDLIAAQRGYIYRDDAPEKNSRFVEMFRRLKERLEKVPSVHLGEWFEEEKAVCDELRIVDSKMLHSLLRRLDGFDLCMKFPFVSLSSDDIPSKRAKA